MPENYAYAGTVTFGQWMSLEEKNRKIDKLPRYLSQHLFHTKSTDYKLQLTKEYHKVGTEDDLEAPHLHFILYSNRRLSKQIWSAIWHFLKDTYGRSQFYLLTNMKLFQWEQYMMKDCKRLYEMTGQSHFTTVKLTKVEDNIWDDEDLIGEDEL